MSAWPAPPSIEDGWTIMAVPGALARLRPVAVRPCTRLPPRIRVKFASARATAAPARLPAHIAEAPSRRQWAGRGRGDRDVADTPGLTSARSRSWVWRNTLAAYVAAAALAGARVFSSGNEILGGVHALLLVSALPSSPSTSSLQRNQLDPAGAFVRRTPGASKLRECRPSSNAPSKSKFWRPILGERK